ncbi:hypothetical protein AB4254_09100 [Vibrio breoganii]
MKIRRGRLDNGLWFRLKKKDGSDKVRDDLPIAHTRRDHSNVG